MILLEINPSTVATIRDATTIIVALIMSYIGITAKWTTVQEVTKRKQIETEQLRLDNGLAWERQQRIDERKELNERLWKIEEKLQLCEKERSRLETLYQEWKSSQTRKGSE